MASAIWAFETLRQFWIGLFARFGKNAAAILGDYRQRALREVAEAVGEFGIAAEDDRLLAPAAVIAKADVAQKEIAQRIDAIAFTEVDWIDDIARRF